MSTLFTGATAGSIADSTSYQANWDLLENSFQDIGPYVVSGLVPSIGTGLSVNVTSGTASIGGRVTKSTTFTIGSLTPSTTNHLYLQRNGTGTANTTGTAPSNSVKLGTAVTGVATVTSVNVLRSSGRQTFVRPENQVPGDVGSPGSLDLSDWNATAGDGFSFFGTLPSGAISLAAAVILAPATANRNLIQPTADVGAIQARPFADNGNTFVNVQNTAGSVSLFGVTAPTGGQVVAIASANTNDVPLFVFPQGSTGVQTEDLIATLNFDTGIFAQVRRWAIDGSSNMYWGDKTTTSARKQASIVRSWVDNTDATRKARLVLNVYDTAARGAIQLDTNGSAGLTTILGAFSLPEVSTSSNTTLNGGHFSIFEDTTAGNKTVTLPTAVGISGRIYAIKNTGTGTNTLTIATTGGQTIDGAAGASTSTPQACLIVQSDGANWQTLAGA